MSLPSPNLDDRDFNQLMEEARQRIAQTCPEWTDLSPGDPGTTLLEVFAHLTETLIYRLNRVPEKAYIEFLRLIGAQLQPPHAAQVRLRFSVASPSTQPIEISRGARVTAARSESGGPPPVFTTAGPVVIEAGQTDAEVPALHAELVVAELAGIGSGLAGQSVTAARAPIIAPTGDDLDLIVGVEAAPAELEGRVAALQHEGKTFRIWREVENFGNLGADRLVYVADRMQGTVRFAHAVRLTGDASQLADRPELLAEVPAPGREIRLWYRRHEGGDGNVAADTLTVLKDPIAGVAVTNPQAATGGQPAESVENALIRAPHEFFSLRRAITARDFELAAERWGGIARARAITKAGLWRHARPGTVEVLLVPHIPEQERSAGRVTLASLAERQTEASRLQIQTALDMQRPLGTQCQVSWARYKSVAIRALIVARREEETDALKSRVLRRIHDRINPLPSAISKSAGWRFGEALRISHVYDMILREPGVRYVKQVGLHVDDVPAREVRVIAADAFQPRTWYAGCQDGVYRSVNDGDGWEAVGRFPGETVTQICTHPERPGLLGVTTEASADGETTTRVHISPDCGETWRSPAELAFETRDTTWAWRETRPVLLLATDKGLYELSPEPDSVPVQILVDPRDANRGVHAVAAPQGALGEAMVAVALDSLGGVYVSREGGRPATFSLSGLEKEDVRVLAIQRDGPRTFLWAGTFASGGAAGKGCYRAELTGVEVTSKDWKQFGAQWTGGSCRALAFQSNLTFAATHRAGVLRFDLGSRSGVWEAPDVNCGLPLRDVGRLHPVDGVAVGAGLLLAAGVEGIYRSSDGGRKYSLSSRDVFDEEVVIPPTWLLCSGNHEIEVVSEE